MSTPGAGKFSVILFYSNNFALWTARVLKQNGVFQKMVPVPRHLSSDCGYCVKFKTCDTESVMKLISTAIEYDRIEAL